MCNLHQPAVEAYRRQVPQLCKILRSLLMAGSTLSGEHDVGGVTDPFLQAKVPVPSPFPLLLPAARQTPACLASLMLSPAWKDGFSALSKRDVAFRQLFAMSRQGQRR